MNLAQSISKLSFRASRFQARGLVAAVTLATLLASDACPNAHGDWPQILGPGRDGHAEFPPVLNTDWPAELPILWRARLGGGYGGSAIVGDRVLTMHRLANKEILVAHSLSDGKQLWECAWPATYRSRMDPDSGPRCVPVVQGNTVICYGAAGDLVAAQLDDGKLLWRRALRQELQADDGYFGAGSTPLVVDGLAIVCLGGKQAGVVGVELDSGETRWTATDHDASYASPIAVESPAGTLALVVTRLDTVLLEAATGKLLGSLKFGGRGPTVNAATPIPLGDNRYFLTASYGIGAVRVAISDSQELVDATASDCLASQYNTPVVIGDQIIGIHGREDVGVASLRAIAADTLEVVWEEPDFGTAHLVAVGPRVLALAADGTVSLLDGKSDKFRRLKSSKLPAQTYRALPAMSGDKLLVRATIDAASSEILCIDLP